MFCSKCGTENPDGAKFCSACGNALASANQPATTAAPAATASYAAPAPSSGGINKGIVIGAIVVLVVAVVLIIVAVTQCSGNDGSAAGSGNDGSTAGSGDIAAQAGPTEKLPNGTYVFYLKSYSSSSNRFEKQVSFKTYDGNTATLEIQGGDLAVSGTIETAGTEGDGTIVKMTDLKYSSSDWGSSEPQEIYLLIPNSASENNIVGTWKLQIKLIRSGSISYMNMYGKVNPDGTVEGDYDTYADEGVITGNYVPSIPEYQTGTSEYQGGRFVFSNRDEYAYYAATVTLN